MKFKSALSVLALILLTGCSGVSNDKFTEGKGGMTEATYKAAEALVAQANAKNVISEKTPLLVGTFSGLDNVEQSTNLGRVVGEQFTTRLVQLGYNVQEVKLRDRISLKPEGEYVLSRDPKKVSKNFNAAALITGTYAKGKDGVLFNARLVSASDNRVIAAQDFILPYEGDVVNLMRDDKKSTGGWYNKDAIIE